MERNALRITAKFGQLGQRFDILYSRFDNLRQREVLSMTKRGSIYSRAELLHSGETMIMFCSDQLTVFGYGWVGQVSPCSTVCEEIVF